MLSQASHYSPGASVQHGVGIPKGGAFQILPCTVSQLLSASQDAKGTFNICDWTLSLVSVVGVVRGYSPFVTNIQYAVDDMTGPPLNVRQWLESEDCSPVPSIPPGKYVKVIGSLRSFDGQRSLLAMAIHRLTDPNEITSHMMEVVHTHLKLFGKDFDVNMNIVAASTSRGESKPGGGGKPGDVFDCGLPHIQSQVLQVVRRFSTRHVGVSFHELKIHLDDVAEMDIRTSLRFLMNEGHIFTTIDDHHFKSCGDETDG